MNRIEPRIGGRYNWKNQPERLVYMGLCAPRNGRWHQFAKVEEPDACWCEVLDEDLESFEESVLPAKMPVPPGQAPVLDTVFAEGWNACCDAYFGGKPAAEPLVITVTAPALAPAREKSEPAPVAQEPTDAELDAFVRRAGFNGWENTESSARTMARFALMNLPRSTAAQGLSEAEIDRFKVVALIGKHLSPHMLGIPASHRTELIGKTAGEIVALLSAAQETKP